MGNPPWGKDRIVATERSISNLLSLSTEFLRGENTMIFVRWGGALTPPLVTENPTFIIVIVVIGPYLPPTLSSERKKNSPSNLPIAKEEKLSAQRKYFAQRKGNVHPVVCGDTKWRGTA